MRFSQDLPASDVLIDTTSQANMHPIDRENSVLIDRKDSVISDMYVYLQLVWDLVPLKCSVNIGGMECSRP